MPKKGLQLSNSGLFGSKLVLLALDTVAKALLLALTWVLGGFLTNKWALAQKRREQDLQTLQKFQFLYGAFLAVWKTWDGSFDKGFSAEVTQASLYETACKNEGELEAILLAVASSRKLDAVQIEDMMLFRQAYKSIRKAIEARKPLNWDSPNHTQYYCFKQLATRVESALEQSYRDIVYVEASDSFQRITDNPTDKWWHEASITQKGARLKSGTLLQKVQTWLLKQKKAREKKQKMIQGAQTYTVIANVLGETDVKAYHTCSLQFPPKVGDYLELPGHLGSTPMEILAVVHSCPSEEGDQKAAAIVLYVRPVESMDTMFQGLLSRKKS